MNENAYIVLDAQGLVTKHSYEKRFPEEILAKLNDVVVKDIGFPFNFVMATQQPEDWKYEYLPERLKENLEIPAKKPENNGKYTLESQPERTFDRAADVWKYWTENRHIYINHLNNINLNVAGDPLMNLSQESGSFH